VNVDSNSLNSINVRIRKYIHALQNEYSGNVIGLNSYISDLNSWKADLLKYVIDRKNLWIIILNSLTPIIKAEMIEINQNF
jgi:hypothetical protein